MEDQFEDVKEQPVSETAKVVEETFGTQAEEVKYPGVQMSDVISPAIAESIRSQLPPRPDNPYEISESWSRGRDYKKPFDYTIEASGQKVKLRRLDMGDLLKLGIAEEMDFMTKALMSNNEQKSGGEAIASAVMQAGNFDRMEGMINKVVLAGLLAPKPHHPPMHHEQNEEDKAILVVDEDAKKDGVLYVDSIPFSDRMELFSVIFESDGLATFRGEQTFGLGNVENVSDVSLPAD